MKEARKKLWHLQGPKGKKITWRDGSERGTQKLEKVSAQMTNAISLKSNDAIHCGAIPILRKQREKVGGVRKISLKLEKPNRLFIYLCR